MTSKWVDGQPVAKCGRNPWYCPYEPTDPACCQYDKEQMEANRKLQKKLQWLDTNEEALDKEYGKMEK